MKQGWNTLTSSFGSTTTRAQVWRAQVWCGPCLWECLHTPAERRQRARWQPPRSQCLRVTATTAAVFVRRKGGGSTKAKALPQPPQRRWEHKTKALCLIASPRHPCSLRRCLHRGPRRFRRPRAGPPRHGASSSSLSSSSSSSSSSTHHHWVSVIELIGMFIEWPCRNGHAAMAMR